MKLPKAFTGIMASGGLLVASDKVLKIKRNCEQNKQGLTDIFFLEQILSNFQKIASDTIKNPDDENAKIEGQVLLELVENVSNGVLVPLKAKEQVSNTAPLLQFSDYLKELAKKAKHKRGQQIDLDLFQLKAKAEAERLLKESLERTKAEIRELKKA